MKLTGWTSAFTSGYPQKPLTAEKKRLLIECVRYRNYDYTYDTLCYVDYCAPFYEDGSVSVPTRAEWDEVLKKAYENKPRTHRLTPMDVIKTKPVNGVLYEKEKFVKGQNNNTKVEV